jgi:hypothetical protein
VVKFHQDGLSMRKIASRLDMKHTTLFRNKKTGETANLNIGRRGRKNVGQRSSRHDLYGAVLMCLIVTNFTYIGYLVSYNQFYHIIYRYYDFKYVYI